MRFTIGVASLLLSSVAAASGDCPQVYQIHGSAPVEQALNIVVIADAFTANNIDDFQCATGLTMEKLVATPPFNRYSDSINIYRVDLVSSHNGVEMQKRCGGKPCNGLMSLEHAWHQRDGQCARFAERSGFEGDDRATLGKPLYPGRAATSNIEVDAHACPVTAPECQLLWPENDGMKIAWQAAACAPVFDVAFVLGNDASWAGGGTNDMHPPLAVATFNGIANWDNRARLLMHEFGHTLGLLDEYGSSVAYSGKNKSGPPYHHSRNLMHIGDGAMPTGADWEHLCTPPTDPRIQEAGLTEFAGGKCFIVCSCEEDCDLPDLPDPVHDNPMVGLYEGAFYNKCGYYRASRVCTMLKPQEGSATMCPACTFYLEGLFQELGIEENAGGPISTDNPDPCEDKNTVDCSD